MKNLFGEEPWRSFLSGVEVLGWTVGVASVPWRGERPSLSEEERCRALKYSSEEDARRYLASRLVLREALGNRFGVDPGSVRFGKAPGGKPFTRSPNGFPPVFFSLSRSGDFCAVALSDDGEVGLDIEKIENPFDWEPASRAWLSEGENRALRVLKTEGERVDAFFRLWCAREAVAKALGEGLRLDPESGGSLEGLLEGHGITIRFGNLAVGVEEVGAPKGYRLAVAALASEEGIA